MVEGVVDLTEGKATKTELDDYNFDVAGILHAHRIAWFLWCGLQLSFSTRLGILKI